MKFNECSRVQVPAALHLCRLGYTYLDNITEYDVKTNILTDVFLHQLKRLNPMMSETALHQELDEVRSMLDNDDLGREFYHRLSANNGVKYLDFEHPENNVWQVTTEFTCEDKESGDNFRPDITCFINGLPLAFIEVKKPNNRDGILAERERIDFRMSNRHFRRFFNITQLMIFSNNQEYEEDSTVPVQGAFYCCSAKTKVFFNVFREEYHEFIENYPYSEISEEEEKRILRHRNCEVIKNSPEYESNKEITTPTNRIITSLLSRERILFLLRYGFTYVNRTIETSAGQIKRLEKHVMRYQQMFASYDIRRMLDRGVRGGIIWHTQGSGKTELAYYSVRSLKDYYAKKNIAVKFYFIVDRIDLMEQASDEFVSRGLLVQNVRSRKELMSDMRKVSLSANKEGRDEITVVNIQKFEEDKQKIEIPDDYSIHLQRVFFIDEAHRGYNPKGSFLANLLEADANAIKIALTGTPLLKAERETWRVFGDYINIYYYDKSIADGYTRKLMREPVETVYKEKIEKVLDKLAGNVEVRKSDIDREKILEHPNYLNALLDYIISDFRKFRIEQDDQSVGAMIVCRSNPQARKLYNLWQARFPTVVNLTASGNIRNDIAAESVPYYNGSTQQPLRAALILHDEGDKEEQKNYIDGFKKKESIDVLIVNKMLLTGFDAPRLKKLYLGRKLDGHDLLQALTRVNRPYHDFKYGYVVDFVDIKENFETTNNRYLRELSKTEDETTPEHGNVGNSIIEDPEEIRRQIAEIKEVLFNYDTSNIEGFRKQIDDIDRKDVLYSLRNTLDSAKEILNQIRSADDKELREKFDKMQLDSIPTMISEVKRRIDHINMMESNSHMADVSGIINVAMSELEFHFKKGAPEELQIVINDLVERAHKVQAEFESNFDTTDEAYVVLADEFRTYFRKRGFTPASVEEVKASIGYMDEVMKKIREINRRNQVLKSKYRGDEKFVRIHKRIIEQNLNTDHPVISKRETEIAENLLKMKKLIDEEVYNDTNLLSNQDWFKMDVLSDVSRTLSEMKIEANVSDKRQLANLIAGEYFQQYRTSLNY